MTCQYKIRSADIVKGTFVIEFEGLNPINCWIPYDEHGFLTGASLDAAIQRIYLTEIEQKNKFTAFSNGAEIEALVEAIEQKQTIDEEVVERARAQRTMLLLRSDWTQLPNAPLTPEQKVAWETYRQALRDVPTQAGFPTTIDWPVAP